MENRETIQELKKALEENSRVIIVDSHDCDPIVELLCKRIDESVERIVVWTNAKVHECKKYRCISDTAMEALIDFIALYEFTDKITLLSRRSDFPGILNYVDTGILATDEAVEALVYKQ